MRKRVATAAEQELARRANQFIFSLKNSVYAWYVPSDGVLQSCMGTCEIARALAAFSRFYGQVCRWAGGTVTGTISAVAQVVDHFRADLCDALLGGTQLSLEMHSPSDQHIVALRADVLNDAEHAFGNLFQRMYHVTRVARDGLGPYADRMTDTLQHLERLLQLVFDYVSPVEIDIRAVDTARVVESLVAHIRAHAAVKIETSGCPSLEVLADSRTLARSFQLLALTFERELASAVGVTIDIRADEGRQRVEFLLQLVGVPNSGHDTQSTLAWEVAARLIELQGGELARTMGVEGYTCTVALPMPEGGHEAA